MAHEAYIPTRKLTTNLQTYYNYSTTREVTLISHFITSNHDLFYFQRQKKLRNIKMFQNFMTVGGRFRNDHGFFLIKNISF